MYKPSTDWNPKQKRLREIILMPGCFSEAMELCCELHGLVHQHEVSDAPGETLADEVYGNLRDEDFRFPGERTIAWNLWHIARIEDATMNILVGKGKQVLNKTWLKKMRTQITDTGNAMTNEEIISFSNEIHPRELLNYRKAVGIRSREILAALTAADMTRTFPADRVEQILVQGCVTEHPDSLWLQDFWGRKTVAGILLLPLTKHQAGHLNDCLKIRKKIK